CCRGRYALQEMALRAAVSILLGWVADRLELGAVWRLKSWERTLLKQLGAAADRVPLIGAPPAQACRRLGLPADIVDADARPTEKRALGETIAVRGRRFL